MIGDLKFVGDSAYVIVNSGGTLEVLPHIGWFKKIVLWLKTRNGDLTISEIRDYCDRWEKELTK